MAQCTSYRNRSHKEEFSSFLQPVVKEINIFQNSEHYNAKIISYKTKELHKALTSGEICTMFTFLTKQSKGFSSFTSDLKILFLSTRFPWSLITCTQIQITKINKNPK